VCGSAKIEKQLMAPAVRTSREVAKQRVAAPGDARQKKLLEAMRQLRRKVEDSAEYVGERFPEEARRIHYQEAAERGIYGEATLEEAKALAEEGIEAHPLPRLPDGRRLVVMARLELKLPKMRPYGLGLSAATM
jgi:hypothetical protein